MPVSGLTLIDDHSTLANCIIPATLAGGASFTCTYSAVVAAGTLENRATADSAETDPPVHAVARVTGTPVINPPPLPSLTISKGVRADPGQPYAAQPDRGRGTVVSYAITVTNTGDVPLTGITLVDDHADLSGCTFTDPLAPGASFTCTYSALAPRGTTTNIATADSAQTDPVSTSATVVGFAVPGFPTITKGVSLSATGPFTARLDTFIGTTVWYRITVLNDGNDTLTGVTLTDSLVDLAGLGCTIPTTLGPGQDFTCTYSLVAVIGATTNTATADSAESPPVSASAVVTARTRDVILTITKGVSTAADGPFTGVLDTTVGTTVWYRITVSNRGDVDQTGITLADSLVADLVAAGCTIPSTLAAHTSFTCQYSVVATAGTATNTATADSDQAKPVSASAVVTAQTIGYPLTIDKGVSLDPAGPFASHVSTYTGDTVYYRITVTNLGEATVTGVILVDNLTDLVAAGCTIPTTLAGHASFTCAYSALAALGTTTNTATADSNEAGPLSASAVVVATSEAAIVITKGVRTTANSGAYLPSVKVAVGATVYFQIVVTNIGNMPLSGVTLTDNLTDLVAAHCTIPDTLAIGASFSCTYSAVGRGRDDHEHRDRRQRGGRSGQRVRDRLGRAGPGDPGSSRASGPRRPPARTSPA